MDSCPRAGNEATERYGELAEQMEVHNNPELAGLFRKMAAIEQQHVDKGENAGRAASRAAWPLGIISGMMPAKSPSVPVGQGHYRMSPHEALMLMLSCEERAFAFLTMSPIMPMTQW
ncbi:MAG: ferritin family protein [Candidatus Competibacteraceae bacterium]